MGDLISRSSLSTNFHRNSAYGYAIVLKTIEEEPTAYYLESVIEQLENLKDNAEERMNHVYANHCDYPREYNLGDLEETRYKTLCDVIEIIKSGTTAKSSKDRSGCIHRHENGNCLVVGGFCTAVDDKYCLCDRKEITLINKPLNSYIKEIKKVIRDKETISLNKIYSDKLRIILAQMEEQFGDVMKFRDED